MPETIDERDRPWGGMGDRIRDARPENRKQMNVFADGERAGLETPLALGAEVYMLTAISGGGAGGGCSTLATGTFLTEADAIPVAQHGLIQPNTGQRRRKIDYFAAKLSGRGRHGLMPYAGSTCVSSPFAL